MATVFNTSTGTLETIDGATSSWGCSHNTGIAFEAADAAPFASICAEDQDMSPRGYISPCQELTIFSSGAVWLNTKDQGMYNTGAKISNENTTNGAGGEAMGGMSGSYSALARLVNSTSYIFAWVFRGAVDLVANEWMGDGYTAASNRTNGPRVVIAHFSDKNTEVGAASGDDQVNWIPSEIGADRSNAHLAVFDFEYALVTWEQIDEPQCDFIAMGCQGTFSGSYFQLVNSAGDQIGDPIVDMKIYVAGDMVTMGDGSICRPYVSMKWELDQPALYSNMLAKATSMSFACMNLL